MLRSAPSVNHFSTKKIINPWLSVVRAKYIPHLRSRQWILPVVVRTRSLFLTIVPAERSSRRHRSVKAPFGGPTRGMHGMNQLCDRLVEWFAASLVECMDPDLRVRTEPQVRHAGGSAGNWGSLCPQRHINPGAGGVPEAFRRAPRGPVAVSTDRRLVWSQALRRSLARVSASSPNFPIIPR